VIVAAMIERAWCKRHHCFGPGLESAFRLAAARERLEAPLRVVRGARPLNANGGPISNQ